MEGRELDAMIDPISELLLRRFSFLGSGGEVGASTKPAGQYADPRCPCQPPARPCTAGEFERLRMLFEDGQSKSEEQEAQQ